MQQMKRHNPQMRSDLLHMTSQSLKEALRANKEIVFVGIGTPRVSGDSFGPTLASKLKRDPRVLFPVYGDIQSPIHNDNYTESIRKIRTTHPNAFLIGMDAFASRSNDIGKVRCAPKEELRKYTSGSHPSSMHDVMILGHTVNKELGNKGLYSLPIRYIRAMVNFSYGVLIDVLTSLSAKDQTTTQASLSP